MIRATLVEPGKLVVEEVERPVPGENEVLVRVVRCGVCGSDATIYRGLHPYAKSPVVMGHEFAGVVEDTGTRVTVIPHLVCGKCEACRSGTTNFCEQLRCMGAEADGAHAEYVVVPADMAVPIPEAMSMDQAAMVEPAAVAYHAARRGEIRSSDTVLVVGAGPIGIFTMQCCRALGAGQVFVADLDAARLALASRLGAAGVIDVSREDMGAGLTRLAGSAKDVELFFDCVGEEGAVLDNILGMARRGTRIVVVGVLREAYRIPHLPDFVQHELRISGTTMYVPGDYGDVIALMENGLILTDGMITHHFDLANVPDVFRMIDSHAEPFFKIMLEVSEAD